MIYKEKHSSWKKLPIVILCCFLSYFLFSNPKLASIYVKNALLLWYENMIPALFPFMILSGFCIRYDLCKYLATPVYPLINKLYKITPDMCCTLIMGTLFGFPIGAKMCAEQYKLGYISQNQAQYLLCFVNNIGPIYMISFALPLLRIPKLMGLFLHMLFPLCYGLFLRYTKYKNLSVIESKNQKEIKVYDFGNALDESITSGCHAIMKLGGYMVLFLLCRFLFHGPIPGILLEITTGLSSYSSKLSTPLLLGFLCFGGLSCMAQTYTVICDTDLSMTNYIFHKIMQSLLVILFSAFLSFLFGWKN